MKPPRTQLIICVLLAILAFPAGPGCAVPPADPPKTLFVYAPSGLNLRQKAEVGSKKIGNIPFGAKVELLAAPDSREITVDNLKGGMAKVRFGELEGYAFDGYMAPFSIPKKDMETEAYVEQLRDYPYEIYFEKVRKDWGGYIRVEEAVVLPTTKWEDAFLVAQQIFEIPASVTFPPPSKEDKATIKNPDPHPEAWSDELIVNRKNGEIQSIEYSYRQEATGQYVTIERYDQEGDAFDGLIIREALIAD